eukprot:gene28813-18575_t
MPDADRTAKATAYMQKFGDYNECTGPYPWYGAHNCDSSSNKCDWVDGSAWGYTGPGFSVDDPYGHFYTDGGWGTWNRNGQAKGICEKVAVVPSFKGYVNDGISKGDEVVLLHMQSLGKDDAANIESMDN